MLTPDDVRCLLIAEDELARCAPLERIFPSYTSHRYMKYIEHPRYYNRLMDAWETRYGSTGDQLREQGIQLLRKFCQQKIHLTVPPQPVKKVINFNSFDHLHFLLPIIIIISHILSLFLICLLFFTHCVNARATTCGSQKCFFLFLY